MSWSQHNPTLLVYKVSPHPSHSHTLFVSWKSPGELCVLGTNGTTQGAAISLGVTVLLQGARVSASPFAGQTRWYPID